MEAEAPTTEVRKLEKDKRVVLDHDTLKQLVDSGVNVLDEKLQDGIDYLQENVESRRLENQKNNDK